MQSETLITTSTTALSTLAALLETAIVPASGPLNPVIPRPMPSPIGVGPLLPLTPPAFPQSPQAQRQATNNPGTTQVALPPPGPPTDQASLLQQQMPVPRFAKLSQPKLVAIAELGYREQQRAERILAANFAQAWADNVDVITDKASAILAIDAINPLALADLPITYSQLNQLFDGIVARIQRWGIEPPPGWSTGAPAMLLDYENGNSST